MILPLVYDWKLLKLFCENVFIKAGVPEERAAIVAESLIEADLRGVDSHGVVRTGIYLQRVVAGRISPTANPEIVHDGLSSVLLDGHNNFGSVVGMEALRIACERARSNGVCIVGVKNSNHFGTGAYYALKAVSQDIALIVMSNASQTMPPTGGVRPFLGTNPLAVGFPAKEELPFILDMATSVVARGKIIVASQKEEDIPLGWAIDKQGRPTTNANEALDGSVLPVGGPKGYGISMFIDILSGVLTGAGYGSHVKNMYLNWEDNQNVGHMYMAININNFMPITVFKDRMDDYIRSIKAEPKGDGVTEILIPGELEHRRTLKQKKEGIQLPKKVVQELYDIGQQYGIDLKTAGYESRKEGIQL